MKRSTNKIVWGICDNFSVFKFAIEHLYGVFCTSKVIMKLSHSVSGAIRQFSYWIANGTVGYPLLEGIDYFDEFKESPSLLEIVYAIFINNLEVDENGEVLNVKYAEQRAAQYIKQ